MSLSHALRLAIVVSAVACASKQPAPVSRPASTLNVAAAAPQIDRVPAAEIQWHGHFGARRAEPHATYTLLASGYFRAPTSADFDSIVAGWLRLHPQAQARIVYVSGPVMQRDPLSQMRAVWLVDSTANLNLELVRAGAAPGGTMFLPSAAGSRVDAPSYADFVAQIREAEVEARREHRGIWAQGETPAHAG